MTLRRFVFFAVVCCLQAGCGGLPVGTPISQVDIPELARGKSRVFFYYGKAGPELVRIASDDNGILKSLVVLNRLNECSFVDLEPGDYTLRIAGSTAGGKFWRTKNSVIDVSIKPEETYYVQVAWYVVPPTEFLDRISMTTKGLNLILLDAEQGKADVSQCLYIKREDTLSKMGKLNGD